MKVMQVLIQIWLSLLLTLQLRGSFFYLKSQMWTKGVWTVPWPDFKQAKKKKKLLVFYLYFLFQITFSLSIYNQMLWFSWTNIFRLSISIMAGCNFYFWILSNHKIGIMTHVTNYFSELFSAKDLANETKDFKFVLLLITESI